MFVREQQITRWLLAAIVAVGSAQATQAQERGRPGPSQASHTTGAFKSADVVAGTITITITEPGERGGGREASTKEKTFSLAKNVDVAVASAAGVGGGRVGASLLKEGKLADLAAGVKVSLMLSADEKTVEGVLAEGPTIHGTLKGVDATKGTITIQMAGRTTGRERAVTEGEEKTYTVGSDVEIGIDDGRGLRFSVKEGKLADLPQKALVTVRLYVDMKKVQSVLAEGPSHTGVVKAVDAAKKTVTLTTRGAGRGDDTGEEVSLSVADDALVVIDDGRGRLLSLKAGKLADVPTGATAMVKLSADQVSITQLRVAGPSLTGHFKAVDADKGIIIITVPKGRDDAEEKTLSLAKDVHVSIDGREAKLADLKLSDPPQSILLRLSLDQKTVQSLATHKGGTR